MEFRHEKSPFMRLPVGSGVWFSGWVEVLEREGMAPDVRGLYRGGVVWVFEILQGNAATDDVGVARGYAPDGGGAVNLLVGLERA